LREIKKKMNQLRRQLNVLKAEYRTIEETCEHKEFDEVDRCVGCGALIDYL